MDFLKLAALIMEHKDNIQDVVALIKQPDGSVKPVSVQFEENDVKFAETLDTIDAWRKGGTD